MIIRIRLETEKPIKLPKSYNHILQAFFYKNMDPALSRFLHDVGFSYGKRKFKLFTFSKVIGKLVNKDIKKGVVVFEPEITLYFASPLMDIVSSSAKTFLRKSNVYLGKNKLTVSSIDIIKPELDTNITVKCLSPITVYRTNQNERRFNYINPWQDEFYELIINNLTKKYEIVYSKSYRGKIRVEPVKVMEGYRKKILYKGTLIEAWEGYFNLQGDPEIIKLALEAGLGAKNPQGFGMVERVL